MLAAIAALSGIAGCKNVTDARTNSFRATHRSWWFGAEQTKLLLHQFVTDLNAAQTAERLTDPLERALAGVSACWYPVHQETKVLKPFIEANNVGGLYDFAQAPTTAYAVPMHQFLKTAEHVPELRSINDSFKKQVARIAFDAPVEFGIDYLLCTAGLTALSCITAAATTIGAGAAACPGFHWVAGLACGVTTSLLGVNNAIKSPWDKATDQIEDRVADAVGDTFDDREGRRKAITERLPVLQNEQGQVAGYIEKTYAEIPQIGWKEMEKLTEVFGKLGSPTTTIQLQGNDVTAHAAQAGTARWIDGTRKRFSADTACKTIAELRSTGAFQDPQAAAVPQGLQDQLSAQGVPHEAFDVLGPHSGQNAGTSTTPSRSQGPQKRQGTGDTTDADPNLKSTLDRYAP